MDTCGCSIWPEREIVLASAWWETVREPGAVDGYLDDRELGQVLDVLTLDPRWTNLTPPVELSRRHRIKLLALVRVGNNGLGRGAVVIRVTNEVRVVDKTADATLVLRLKAYADDAPTSDTLTELTPAAVGKLLDELVDKLRQIPGLASVTHLLRS